jgi:hypothetical protein
MDLRRIALYWAVALFATLALPFMPPWIIATVVGLLVVAGARYGWRLATQPRPPKEAPTRNDMRRAGDEAPSDPTKAFDRASGKNAWMRHGGF